MLKNYIKVAFRNLWNQKGNSVINILGLALGLMCFILIGLFVRYELKFDKFHDKSDRIFRIASEMPASEHLGKNQWTVTPSPIITALTSDIPEVENAAQISKAKSLIDLGNSRFYEDGIFASEQFFEVFSFQVINGNPTSALIDPHSIVLTRSLAEKYFGKHDPLGKVITVSYLGENFSGKKEMKVTGLIEDVPANSHFTFDYIVPVKSCQEYVNYIDRWDSNSFLTYVTLKPGIDVAGFSSKLKELGKNYLPQEEYYAANPENMHFFYPQALADIHLFSDLNGEFRANGDVRYIYLFSAIGLLILLIACINYINLAVARSTVRTVEVGIRKTIGAHRRQLLVQFMSEAILPSFLSLLLALALAEILLPLFNALSGNEMIIGYNSGFFYLLLGIGFLLGLIAGIYPALIMSGFAPISMLKGAMSASFKKSRFRNVLVTFQFIITIMLIISVIVVHRQLHYIHQDNTGVERDQIIVVPIEDKAIHLKYSTLNQTLTNHPSIELVTAGQSNPTEINSSSIVKNWEGAEEDQAMTVYRSVIQYNYLNMFGIQLLEGKDFSESNHVDGKEGVIINETAMKQLGWDTAVGKEFPFRDRSRIIGVVKDFKFLSFHHELAPLAFTLESGWWFPYQRIFIKVNEKDMQETLAYIEKTMMAQSPEYPFSYYFLDTAYAEMYRSEVNLGTLMKTFAFLAVIISCLGLLGLATFVAKQRTKEIGVRKVLGATVVDILSMLSRDFTRMVFIAFVIGSPIAYYMNAKWLEEFAYRIPVGWQPFAIAAAIILFFAWATIGIQSIKASTTNPVDSLKCE